MKTVFHVAIFSLLAIALVFGAMAIQSRVWNDARASRLDSTEGPERSGPGEPNDSLESMLNSPEFLRGLEEHRRIYVQGTTGKIGEAAGYWPGVIGNPMERRTSYPGTVDEFTCQINYGATAFDWTIVTTEVPGTSTMPDRWSIDMAWGYAKNLSWFPIIEAWRNDDYPKELGPGGNELLEWELKKETIGLIRIFELRFRLKRL